nr:ATP-binding cassette sub-family A member 17-like [Drosophila bipectinata]
MDEVASNCSRIGVLVSGEMKPPEEVQNMQAQNSRTLVLKMKVQGKPQDQQEVLRKLASDMSSFQGSSLTKRVGCCVVYNLSQVQMDKVVQFVESKKTAWKLESYSVSPASLEDVFMKLDDEKKEAFRFSSSSDDSENDKKENSMKKTAQPKG